MMYIDLDAYWKLQWAKLGKQLKMVYRQEDWKHLLFIYFILLF